MVRLETMRGEKRLLSLEHVVEGDDDHLAHPSSRLPPSRTIRRHAPAPELVRAVVQHRRSTGT